MKITDYPAPLPVPQCALCRREVARVSAEYWPTEDLIRLEFGCHGKIEKQQFRAPLAPKGLLDMYGRRTVMPPYVFLDPQLELMESAS